MASEGDKPDAKPGEGVPPEWTVAMITVAASKGPQFVAGWVSCLFGLDFRPIWFPDEPLPCGFGWCVTHLPTGYGAFGVILSLTDAMAVADEAAALPGMDKIGAMDPRFMVPRLQPLRERLGPRLIHVSNMVQPWTLIDDPTQRPEGVGP